MTLPLITMGGYSPGRSLLHRADPRSKIILTLLFMVTLYGVKSYPALLLLFVFILLTTLGIGRTLTDSWRGLRPILWLAACAAFLNTFLVSGTPVATVGIFSHISWEGLDRSAKMVLRLILLVSSATVLTATTTPLALTAGLERLLQPLQRIKIPVQQLAMLLALALRLILLVSSASVLTATTTPLALTAGLERLLHPLRRIKVPVQQLAMLLALALRFIPVIVEEAERIIKAQASRSPAFNNGNLRQRLQSYSPLLLPLFVAIFRRGEALATAMESRCYRGEIKRSRMRPLHFSSADLTSSVVMFLFFTLLFFVENTFV